MDIGRRMIIPGKLPLDRNSYIKKCWELVENYIEGVKKEEIIVGKYIKLSIEKYLENQKSDKFDFRKDKVDKVFSFFSFVNTKYKDKYVQFPMLDWQAFFIAMIYGYYYKGTNRRKVNEILLFIGRKNGKTNFAAGLMLYSMLKDDVADPNSILLAIGTAQGKIALRAAKTMIYHSPALLKRLYPQVNKILPVSPSNQGFAEVLSTVDPDRLEGYNPSMCIIDECHGFDPEKIGAVYNAILQGTGERQNPIVILASTAGKNDNEWFINRVEYHKSVLEGKINDPTVASLIYQPDKDDDLSNYKNWYKANPSMDLIFPRYKIEEARDKAKNSASSEDLWYYLTKRMNIFYDRPDTWLNIDMLKKCFRPVNIMDFKGKPCMVAVDLSMTEDLTALSAVFEDENRPKHLYVFTWFFMADKPGNIIRKNGFDLTPYIKSGIIQKSSTNRVDGQQIMDKIRELNMNFQIEKFLYDPFGSPYFISDIQRELQIYVEPYRQTSLNFNAPINFVEEKVSTGDITFAENPVLLWNFGNVVIKFEGANENKKFYKNKKRDAIDGAVSAVMAIGGYLSYHYPVVQ